MTFTKPPPPPPKFARLPQATRPVPLFKDLGAYQLPMHSEYMPAWRHILKTCGYPTDVVVLDFETYFDEEYHMGRSGDSLSTIEYVQDKRFEVLGLARTIVTQPFPDYENQTNFEAGEAAVESFIRYLQQVYGQDLERCTVVIQNAAFDATVLARRYNCFPRFLIDTLALARHWNARQKHGLETLANQFNLKQKGETAEFKGLSFRQRFVIPKGRKKGPKMPQVRSLITDEQVLKLAGYANNDAAREWEIFTILLPRLSNPAVELRLQKHTLELFTKPTLLVDAEYGADLAKQYEAQIDIALAPTGNTREEISGNNSFDGFLSEALHACGDAAIKYMKVCKATASKPSGMMLGIAKADDTRDELMKHPDERVRQLMIARTAIKSWPLHVARVNKIMAQAAANGGVLPVPLKYCGAHTGRWSGGEGINLQNLAKQGLLALIRQLLKAAPGYTLVIVDAAAIEARVLAWIAGQWDLVEKFQNGEEIYCGFASKVLGYACRKPRKSGGIPAVEQRFTWARNAIGKIGVLGCGYGMGQDKLFALGEGQFDLDMALRIRDTYRSENAAIVQFWKDIERAFIYTAKYQQPCSLPRGLRFHSTQDADVIITLPNGRELKYAQVKIVADKYGDKAEVYNAVEHCWEHIWGGTLTENVVQAMSRDVLAECILRLEDQGVHVSFHCHDEVVCALPVEAAEAALKLAIAEMSRVPVWAPRMPLAAEGCLSERYKK